MENKITIKFTRSETDFDCQIDVEHPFDITDLNCCIFSLLNMFSENSHIPAIQLINNIQNAYIADMVNYFNQQQKTAEETKLN